MLLHSKTATRELEKSTEVHRYPACLCTKCSNHQPCLGIHSAGCYAQSILHMLGTDGMSCCCSSWYHACSTLFTLRGVRVEPERFSSDGTVCYAYHSMCMPIRLGVQPTGNILHCAPNPPPPWQRGLHLRYLPDSTSQEVCRLLSALMQPQLSSTKQCGIGRTLFSCFGQSARAAANQSGCMQNPAQLV